MAEQNKIVSVINFKYIIKLIIISILVLVTLSSAIYYIITDDGSYKETGSSGSSGSSSGGSSTGNNSGGNSTDSDENEVSSNSNVRYVLEEFINKITIDSIVSNNNGGYAYATDLDDQIEEMFKKYPKAYDKILQYIEIDEEDKADEEEAENEKTAKLKEKKAKELIEKFVKAEIIGKYPDLRSENEISKDKKIRDNELQGGIKVVRRDSGTDTTSSSESELTYKIYKDDQILTYIPYEQFTSKLASNDKNITNYFSLKSSGVDSTSVDIVVAGWTKETTKRKHTTITTIHTTEITETVEGDITKKDDTEGPSSKTKEEDPIYRYTYHEISINYQSSLTKYSMPAGFLWSLLVSGEDTEFVEQLADLAIDNTEIIIEAQDNITTTVDTEIVKYDERDSHTSKKETKTEEGEVISTTTTKTVTTRNHEEVTTIETVESNTRLNLTYAETWVATYKRLYQNNKTNEEITSDWIEEINWDEISANEKEIQQNKDTVVTVNAKTANNSQTINSNEYTFAGTQVQDRHYIDEEHNFIKYFNESGRAILETTSWLYEMLESHEKTADMVDLVKYLLSQATGSNYGITAYNFQEYDFDEFESSQMSSGTNCPRYYQMDQKWASKAYNYKVGGTIGKGGCGACALAMAVSGLTGNPVAPDTIVDYLNDLGINTVSNGTACAQAIAQQFGLTYEYINRTDKEKIDQALDNGKCLIFSVTANGIYTGEGHYIMCNGRNENGYYYVLESSHYYETDRPYAFDQVFTAGNQGIFALGR